MSSSMTTYKFDTTTVPLSRLPGDKRFFLRVLGREVASTNRNWARAVVLSYEYLGNHCYKVEAAVTYTHGRVDINVVTVDMMNGGKAILQ